MSSSSKQPPAKEISTDAIASFVYGTIQITLAVIVVVLVWYFTSKVGEMVGMTGNNTPQRLEPCISDGIKTCDTFQSAPTTKPTTPTASENIITVKETAFIFISNILSFFGITSGFSALRDIAKTDKIGSNLATLGLVSSFFCLGITICLTWFVDLPL